MKNKTILLFLLMSVMLSCVSNKPIYKIEYLESGFTIYTDREPLIVPEDMKIYKLKNNRYKLVKHIKE